MPNPIRQLSIPVDTWERHAVVAGLVGRPGSLLDVGGVPGGLAPFLSGTRVTTANVEPPADVLIGATRLPFDDASFDAATSLDVLEHLPRGDRAGHLRELVRVARDRIVLCCPFGTPQHEQAERALSEWYRDEKGEGHRFLEEHLAHGLPTEEELRALSAASGWDVRIAFHGDFRDAAAAFRRLARRRPIDLAREAVARLLSRPALSLSATPTPFTNRAFLVATPRTKGS